jgi:hypothetical protein
VLTEHGCKIAPNTYWVARKRPLSKRAIRDAELVEQIQRAALSPLPPAKPPRCSRTRERAVTVDA